MSLPGLVPEYELSPSGQGRDHVNNDRTDTDWGSTSVCHDVGSRRPKRLVKSVPVDESVPLYDSGQANLLV